VASKILQSRCCSSRLAPNRVEKVGRQFTAQSVAVQPSERVASLILCDAATIIPPPGICRERTGIARSKGPEPPRRVIMRAEAARETLRLP